MPEKLVEVINQKIMDDAKATSLLEAATDKTASNHEIAINSAAENTGKTFSALNQMMLYQSLYPYNMPSSVSSTSGVTQSSVSSETSAFDQHQSQWLDQMVMLNPLVAASLGQLISNETKQDHFERNISSSFVHPILGSTNNQLKQPFSFASPTIDSNIFTSSLQFGNVASMVVGRNNESFNPTKTSDSNGKKNRSSFINSPVSGATIKYTLEIPKDSSSPDIILEDTDSEEQILLVECGSNKAMLYISKLCQGSKGKSILFQNNWLTPNEFQALSGRETAKDWKRSIRHCGKSLKVLMTKKILLAHGVDCSCSCCEKGINLLKDIQCKKADSFPSSPGNRLEVPYDLLQSKNFKAETYQEESKESSAKKNVALSSIVAELSRKAFNNHPKLENQNICLSRSLVESSRKRQLESHTDLKSKRVTSSNCQDDPQTESFNNSQKTCDFINLKSTSLRQKRTFQPRHHKPVNNSPSQTPTLDLNQSSLRGGFNFGENSTALMKHRLTNNSDDVIMTSLNDIIMCSEQQQISRKSTSAPPFDKNIKKDIGKKNNTGSSHEKYFRLQYEDVPTVSRGLSDDVWKNINHAAEDLSRWDVDDVCNFLDEVGLFQYQDIFRKNCINGDSLPLLREGHLIEMGFKLGHALQLIARIHRKIGSFFVVISNPSTSNHVTSAFKNMSQKG